MRQPRPMLIGDRDRIAALERRADEHDKMADQVKEIHELLFGAKAILWFVTKLSAWCGGVVAMGAGSVMILKFFRGG